MCSATCTRWARPHAAGSLGRERGVCCCSTPAGLGRIGRATPDRTCTASFAASGPAITAAQTDKIWGASGKNRSASRAGALGGLRQTVSVATGSVQDCAGVIGTTARTKHLLSRVLVCGHTLSPILKLVSLRVCGGRARCDFSARVAFTRRDIIKQCTDRARHTRNATRTDY